MKTINRIIPNIIGAALILITACEKLPVASFTVSPPSSWIGDTIYFQNTSEGANTFDWDFGDGSGSIEENPSHIYTAEGVFTIHLEVTNADGSDEASRDLMIRYKPPQPVWTFRTDMPTGRWELSTCVVDGKIYAIGGAGPVYQALHTVEQYDPATNTWSTKSQMPTARQALSTNVVNGKIYAIGGGVASSAAYASVETFSTVEEYDPATDTWTTKSEMPTARGFHSANVVDGRIYVIGGSPVAPGNGSILTVEVYDPATDTWTQKGDMPESRRGGFTSVVNGKIYGFGGYTSRTSTSVDEYDPVTDTWTEKANMPTYRIGLSTSVLNGKIYAIGGYVPGVPDYPGVKTMEVYDPATDSWTTGRDMPTGRWGLRTSVVDGKIYVIGGVTLWGKNACGTVEVFYFQ